MNYLIGKEKAPNDPFRNRNILTTLVFSISLLICILLIIVGSDDSYFISGMIICKKNHKRF
jgi:hypothetical protein